MFKLTIETDNPAVLAAIAKAVESVPPKGWEEGRGKAPKINVHASLASMKDATENVNTVDGVTVTQEVIPEEPSVTPKTDAAIDDAVSKAKAKREAAKAEKPEPEVTDAGSAPPDAEAQRVALRGLVVKVSKETSKSLKEATAAATEAAGLDSPSQLANCSPEAYAKAKAALEMILVESA